MSFVYCVVIVTYNRLEKLKRCINCVLDQSITPQRIIVVNNNSSDGTFDYLNDLDNERINIINMDDNYGGAGGFSRGVEEAIKLSTDWIVLIDDDAMLKHDFSGKIYAQIEKDKSEGKMYAAYAGAVMEHGKIACKHRRRIKKRLIYFEKEVPQEEYEKGSFECDQVSFCGMVLNRKMAEDIGIPRADFFIWNDDIEYSMRLLKYGGLCVVTKSIVYHECEFSDISTKAFNFFPFDIKEYYGIRNSIIVCKEYYNGITTFLMICFIFIRKIKQLLFAFYNILFFYNNTSVRRENIKIARNNMKLLSAATIAGVLENMERWKPTQ